MYTQAEPLGLNIFCGNSHDPKEVNTQKKCRHFFINRKFHEHFFSEQWNNSALNSNTHNVLIDYITLKYYIFNLLINSLGSVRLFGGLEVWLGGLEAWLGGLEAWLGGLEVWLGGLEVWFEVKLSLFKDWWDEELFISFFCRQFFSKMLIKRTINVLNTAVSLQVLPHS